MEDRKRALGRRIYELSHLTGRFILRSGQVSDEYFDKYMFESDPKILRGVAEQMVALLPSGVEVLAGLELGGVPLATAMSFLTGMPSVFVRKEAKTYGTCKLAEGIDYTGKRVAVIEDVISTGGAVVDSAHELERRGGIIWGVYAVIDRETGGRETIEEEGWRFGSLFTQSELHEIAERGN